MYDEDYNYQITPKPKLPRVPIERRIGAFVIDFLVVSFVSSFFGSIFWLIFFLGWLGMRILLVAKNRGQSLGRYALDMSIIDPRYDRIPELLSLTKRESIIGFAGMLTTIGLSKFPNGLTIIFLATPLLIIALPALFDEERDRGLHDRLAKTIVVPTERGFSLDIKLKKILATIKRNVQKY